MNKGLDLIKRRQPEIIDGFPTGNIYIGVTEEELAELEKELKVLRFLKGINFDIVYREQFDEWTLFIVIETQDGEYLEPVTFGEGKDQYELLKEVLMNELK